MIKKIFIGFLSILCCVPFVVVADTAVESNIAISSINSSHSDSEVTLSWSTNVPTNTTIKYGRTAEYGMFVASESQGTDHTQTISGLAPDTTYHFQISASDSSGNRISSSDVSVVTSGTNDGSSNSSGSSAGGLNTSGSGSGVTGSSGAGAIQSGATNNPLVVKSAAGSDGDSGTIDFSQVVQCGGTNADGSDQPPCDYNQIVKIVNSSMRIVLYLIPGVGTVVLMWAGFMFMTSGDNPGRRSMAKKALLNIGIGIVVMLGAWLIVYTLMTKLMPEGSDFLKSGGKTQTVEEVIQLKK